MNQHLQENLANMLIDLFTLESTLSRIAVVSKNKEFNIYAPFLKLASHVNSDDRDIIKSIRFAESDYTRFKLKFNK